MGIICLRLQERSSEPRPPVVSEPLQSTFLRGWFPLTRRSSAWHSRNTAGISVTSSFHSAEILDMRLEQLHKIDYTANLHPNGGWISSTQSGGNQEADSWSTLPMTSICGWSSSTQSITQQTYTGMAAGSAPHIQGIHIRGSRNIHIRGSRNNFRQQDFQLHEN